MLRNAVSTSVLSGQNQFLQKRPTGDTGKTEADIIEHRNKKTTAITTTTTTTTAKTSTTTRNNNNNNKNNNKNKNKNNNNNKSKWGARISLSSKSKPVTYVYKQGTSKTAASVIVSTFG